MLDRLSLKLSLVIEIFIARKLQKDIQFDRNSKIQLSIRWVTRQTICVPCFPVHGNLNYVTSVHNKVYHIETRDSSNKSGR